MIASTQLMFLVFPINQLPDWNQWNKRLADRRSGAMKWSGEIVEWPLFSGQWSLYILNQHQHQQQQHQ